MPAGTFDTYKVELSPDDGQKTTVWVAKDSRQAVKISSVVPRMNGAGMTSELQPKVAYVCRLSAFGDRSPPPRGVRHETDGAGHHFPALRVCSAAAVVPVLAAHPPHLTRLLEAREEMRRRGTGTRAQPE